MRRTPKLADTGRMGGRGKAASKTTPKKPQPPKRSPRKVYLQVATLKYGRPPMKNEVIHHTDTDAFNNEPSNLVYLPKIVHLWLHRLANWGKLKGYEEDICLSVRRLAEHAKGEK